MNKKLIVYVQDLLNRGYDVSTVRANLLKYNYTDQEINEAINSALGAPTINLKHELHISSSGLIGIGLVIIGILIFGWFFLYSSDTSVTDKETLLDVSVQPIDNKVRAGEKMRIENKIINLGSKERYDVLINTQLIEKRTNKAITQTSKTIAIETSADIITELTVPVDARAGKYLIKTSASYDNQKAVATTQVEVISKLDTDTDGGKTGESKDEDKGDCFDGIRNQDETGVDCGGVCKRCSLSNSNGDKIDPFYGLTPDEKITEIREIAKTEPERALEECNKFQTDNARDKCISNIGEVQLDKSYCTLIENNQKVCYTNIALATNDPTLCSEITKQAEKDSCYLNLVIGNHNYEVCDQIINVQTKWSCNQLKRLSEINNKINSEVN